MTTSAAGYTFLRYASVENHVRALIFDPFAGISGDMTLGALLDLGLGADWLVNLVSRMALEGVDVRVDKVKRAGIAAPHVVVTTPEQEPHRTLEQVLAIVTELPVTESARERAVAAFRAIAAAEARVHGRDGGHVHFHEVGALDAIVDIVGTMAAVEALGFVRCFTRPVAVGSGEIQMAHGRFPSPAPATVELLEGMAIRQIDEREECTTPTGAAILRVLTGGARAPAEVTLQRTGYGAGARNPKDRPNVLRVMEVELSGQGGEDRVYMVQADLDDHDPEYLPVVRQALATAGALDVVTLPVDMKKSRTGVRIEALVPEGVVEAVVREIFLSTPTIGVRYWPVQRQRLAREVTVIEWEGHRIRVKLSWLPDGRTRCKPEFDDVLAAAEALGVRPMEVLPRIEAELVARFGDVATIPSGSN